MQSAKPQAAIYARYSSDRQSPTSIEDQIRQCRELAEQHGYEVADSQVYFDRAVTGKRSGLQSREGFAKLQEAVQSRTISCVVIDEVSRAGRDLLTLATFVNDLNSKSVRLLVRTPGLDSQTPHFMMYLTLMTGLAVQESEQTRERTSRGMLGALERGGMVGYPPFGYRLVPKLDGPSGQGAQFAIDEAQAKLVKEMFELRRLGESYYSIASTMQDRGIPIPRAAHKPEGGYWRSNTVKQLLQNSLYRGVFTWNGSSYSKNKAKKQGKALKPKEFPRPSLRIVDDELWFDVQTEDMPNPRKGYKHPYNRRVTCGVCGNSCSLHYRQNSAILTCAVCEQRRRVCKDKNMYCQVGVRALDAVIKEAFRIVNEDSVKEAYKEALLGLANLDCRQEIESINSNLQRVKSRISTIGKMLMQDHGDADALSSAYEQCLINQKVWEVRLDALKNEQASVSPETIEEHIDGLSAQWYLEELFERQINPSQANELIGQIFPEIRFYKRSKNISDWELTVDMRELQLPVSCRSVPNVEKVKLCFEVFCDRRNGTSYSAKPVTNLHINQ